MAFEVYRQGKLFELSKGLCDSLWQAIDHDRPRSQQEDELYDDLKQMQSYIPRTVKYIQTTHHLVLSTMLRIVPLSCADIKQEIDLEQISAYLTWVQTPFQATEYMLDMEIDALLVLAKFLNTYLNQDTFRSHFITDIIGFIQPFWRFIDHILEQCQLKFNGHKLTSKFLIEQNKSITTDLDVLHYALMTFLHNNVLLFGCSPQQQQKIFTLILDYKASKKVAIFDLAIVFKHFIARGLIHEVIPIEPHQKPLYVIPNLSELTYKPMIHYNWQEEASHSQSITPQQSMLIHRGHSCPIPSTSVRTESQPLLTEYQPMTIETLARDLAEIREYQQQLQDSPTTFVTLDFQEILSRNPEGSERYITAIAVLQELQRIHKSSMEQQVTTNRFVTTLNNPQQKAKIIAGLQALVSDISKVKKNDTNLIAQALKTKLQILIELLNTNLTEQANYQTFYNVYTELETFIKNNLGVTFDLFRPVLNETVSLGEIIAGTRKNNLGLRNFRSFVSPLISSITASLEIFEKFNADNIHAENTLQETIAALETAIRTAEEEEASAASAASATGRAADLSDDSSDTTSERTQPGVDVDTLSLASSSAGHNTAARSTPTMRDPAPAKISCTWLYLTCTLTAVTAIAATAAAILNLWIIAGAVGVVTVVSTSAAIYNYRSYCQQKRAATLPPLHLEVEIGKPDEEQPRSPGASSALGG